MPRPTSARHLIQQLPSLRLLPRHRDGPACATNMCKVNINRQPGKHMLTAVTRRPLTVPPRHAVHNLIATHRSNPTVHGTIHNTVIQDSKCASLDNLAHTNIQKPEHFKPFPNLNPSRQACQPGTQYKPWNFPSQAIIQHGDLSLIAAGHATLQVSGTATCCIQTKCYNQLPAVAHRARLDRLSRPGAVRLSAPTSRLGLASSSLLTGAP